METVSFIDVISQILEFLLGIINMILKAVWNGFGSPFVFNFSHVFFWRVFLVVLVIIGIGKLTNKLFR
jgi:hypothetical protein